MNFLQRKQLNKKRKLKKSFVNSQDRAIMEEEEKTENEEEEQNTFIPPKPIIYAPVPPIKKTGNKEADREAYLLRPPNQTITLI